MHAQSKKKRGRKNKGKSDKHCEICDKSGHVKENHWAPGDKKIDQSAVKATTEETFTFTCTFTFMGVANSLQIPLSKQGAIIDNRASSHFCPNKLRFINYWALEGQMICTTNDGTIPASGVGDESIELSNGTGRTKCILKDAIYTPDMALVLISISHLIKTNCSTTFKGGHCVIQNLKGVVITTLPLSNGLYHLGSLACQQIPTSCQQRWPYMKLTWSLAILTLMLWNMPSAKGWFWVYNWIKTPNLNFATLVPWQKQVVNCSWSSLIHELNNMVNAYSGPYRDQQQSNAKAETSMQQPGWMTTLVWWSCISWKQKIRRLIITNRTKLTLKCIPEITSSGYTVIEVVNSCLQRWKTIRMPKGLFMTHHSRMEEPREATKHEMKRLEPCSSYQAYPDTSGRRLWNIWCGSRIECQPELSIERLPMKCNMGGS